MTIAILGAGAWGTALANAFAAAGRPVRLWTRDAATASAIAGGASPRYLPGVALDRRLVATTDPALALAGVELVLAAVPAQTLRGVLAAVAPLAPPAAPLVLCAKGIEAASGALLSDVAAAEWVENPVAVLSGPSFAADVARFLPTAVTIAASDLAVAKGLAARLSTPALRLYSTDDIVGVEIGGALKNVLAIAAGAAAGAGLGASAAAALITRGFVELRRLGAAFGARPQTLMGLSGLGDLILTCSSAQSRNYSYGLALGRDEALSGRPLAEGVATAGIAARLAVERGLDTPIVAATAALLDGRIRIGEAVEQLLARPLKDEDA